MSKVIPDIVDRYPLISEQVSKAEVKIILDYLSSALRNTKQGDVVELGCYTGTTSLFIQRLLQLQNYDRQFHVYDSFEGLPPKSSKDQSPAGEQFVAGELSASKKEFITNFKKANLRLPIIHKDWFSELSEVEVPRKIAFAFLDGDYYQSIRQSLALIENKLVPGSVVVVDDYQSEALPGARKAVDEWLVANPNHKLRITNSLAIIRGDTAGYPG